MTIHKIKYAKKTSPKLNVACQLLYKKYLACRTLQYTHNNMLVICDSEQQHSELGSTWDG